MSHVEQMRHIFAPSFNIIRTADNIKKKGRFAPLILSHVEQIALCCRANFNTAHCADGIKKGYTAPFHLFHVEQMRHIFAPSFNIIRTADNIKKGCTAPPFVPRGTLNSHYKLTGNLVIRFGTFASAVVILYRLAVAGRFG